MSCLIYNPISGSNQTMKSPQTFSLGSPEGEILKYSLGLLCPHKTPSSETGWDVASGDEIPMECSISA